VFRLAFCLSDFAWAVLIFYGDVALALIALPIGLHMDCFLGGLHVFWMLGGYVQSSGTLIPTLQVMLDISVVRCTLLLHCGTTCKVIAYEDFSSSWVIHHFKVHFDAHNSSPVIGIVEGAKCCFVLEAFIPKISERGYHFSNVALLRVL
jgi:hypothetical protein